MKNYFLIRKQKYYSNVCNMCGTKIDKWDIEQDFSIIHNFIAYTPHSKYDGKIVELRLCNKCIDKLMGYLIDNCKVNPIKDNDRL